MAISGLCWLTFLSPPLANYLSPYMLALALLLEGLVMLWLLVMGVSVQRWKEKTEAASGVHSPMKARRLNQI
jgi:hypothetical protein